VPPGGKSSELDPNPNYYYYYIKIYIKTTPTCFGTVTPSSGSVLLVFTKVTVVKITLQFTSNALLDDGVTVPKHVGVVLM
jgi:hypothetical protein